MAEYSANATQTVAPNGSVIFTEAPVPCTRGLVRHRDGSGVFLLKGYVPYNMRCSCNCGCSKSANYLALFKANVAIPTGGTAGEISLSLALNGSILPDSTMIVTPTEVEAYNNVFTAITVPVWAGCCETLSIVNPSDQAILVQNAVINISRPDLVMTR